MNRPMITSRRNFLKRGAVAAVPAMAIAAPAVALAADDSKARLLRIEDERAIEALGRDFVRRFNLSGARGTAGLFADGQPPRLEQGSARLALDPSAEPELLEIAADGASARSRHAVTLEREHALEGRETLVQMARLQGNAATRSSAQRMLVADYVKRDGRWAIGSLRLA